MGAKSVGRYHTNDEGRTLPCTAGVRDCRFVHGDTPGESAANWQQTMEEGLIPQPQSREVDLKERLTVLRATALKDLSDVELADAIMLESRELGFDTGKMSESIALASFLHGDQWRKGSRGNLETPPYIEHPLRNALRLIRLGVEDEHIIQGAVLHDTVEDGSYRFAKSQGLSNSKAKNEHASREMLTIHLQRSFGERTTHMVVAVTNDVAPSNHRELSAEAKHQIYADHMAKKVVNDPGSFLIKLTDYIDNATGLYHNVATMDKQKIANQARKYLKALPIFESAAKRLDLPIPTHSKALISEALRKTEYRLQRIVDGWDGHGKI